VARGKEEVGVAVEPSALLIPAIYVVTILITATSALYVYRQRATDYPQVRNLLVMVHIFYIGVVAFELARNFVPPPINPVPPFTSFFLSVYTISNTSFVLADVLLLTLVAIAIYYRPTGKKLSDILRELGRHQAGMTLLVVYITYIAIAEGYLLAAQPWCSTSASAANSCTSVTNLLGAQVVATEFNPQYLDMLLGILLVFLVYPTALFLAARQRTGDVAVRRAFTILPVAWVGIGVDLLVFDGYLLNNGIDATAVGYLFAAAAFSATAATFRRATLLSAFFQPGIAPTPTAPPATTFSGRLGLKPEDSAGRVYLLEVDSSSKFEDPVRDLANELGSTQQVLYAFTAAGSPVYSALSGTANVRFFTMTRKVSYPKQGEKPNEVLVPSADQSVLLNVLDKAITSNPDLKFGVVFDSVTDLMLSSGLEVTYKFLKQANEMLTSRKVTAVFLMTIGAHTEREVSVLKGLFSNIAMFQHDQLVVQKSASVP
jgi:hypothetical protein